ncbi:hypothetical protein NDU88_000194 [Pleurodeles waltl]|uniref:KRAB domain-containing protein n=1 Tax=Pleurodeles waltl TaxID=8319 RepID=A0AAV7P3H0_PLEWA|nr:hypothetical protein NDU88_000194 [Pleurodeles waltl]
MPTPQPDQVQVTIQDTFACFSKEEWKLLQEWQKELYRNVMKEIHQALIALGPLIATTVSSLTAKEKQELPSRGHPEPERSHANLSLNNDTCPEKDEEPISVFLDRHCMEVERRITDPSSGLEITSVHIKEEEEDFDCSDHHNNKEVVSANSQAGHPIISSLFSQKIKSEEGMCLQESTKHERRVSAEERRSVKMKANSSAGDTERTAYRRARVKDVKKAEKGAPSRGYVWSEGNEEPRADTVTQKGPGHFQNTPCREAENSVGKKEEDGDKRRVRTSIGETQSQPGDVGTRSQGEEVQPEDGEPLAQGGESQLDNSQKRQFRKESQPEDGDSETTGDVGGRGRAGTSHVLRKTWPDQVQGVYWGWGGNGKDPLPSMKALDE